MANLRQTILVRTDLGFTVGLMAAQVAHLHFQRIRRFMMETDVNRNGTYSNDDMEWIKTPYVFIHGVPNIETLNYFNKLAVESGVPVCSWTDTVYIGISETQKKAFNDVLVGIVLGPCDSDKIKAVVGDLPLL